MLVVFPAGGASTAPKLWSKRAVDAEWKNFAARLITPAKAPVVPVYFAGQNSRLFQIASHISMTFRLSLFFKEVYDKIGSELHVRIGDVIPYSELDGMDRTKLMEHLRTQDLRARRFDPAQAHTRTASGTRAAPRLMTGQDAPRVALFVTCLADMFRPQVGFAAAKLLEQAGCKVEVPVQSCCGQPAYNGGDAMAAAAVARNVIATFEPYDFVVAPSGSCAGMIRVHYPRLLQDDEAWAQARGGARREDARIVLVPGECARGFGGGGRVPCGRRLSQFLLVAARDGREGRAAAAACLR